MAAVIPAWSDPDDWLNALDEIRLNTMTWQMHQTPGHSRGHVVFVHPGRDMMLADDRVLPHITPSIGFEQNHAELPDRQSGTAAEKGRANPSC